MVKSYSKYPVGTVKGSPRPHNAGVPVCQVVPWRIRCVGQPWGAECVCFSHEADIPG